MVNAIHASLVGELAMSAVGQCKLTQIIAHEAACAAGVLHRDISAGNIMIVDDDEPNVKGGILIDWDLSKVIDPPDERSTARQYTRTVSKVSDAVHLLSTDISQGTWQFMAADLVQRSTTPHTFVHDLESAFWVMFWIVLSYMPSSWEAGERSSFLRETMSPRVYHNTGGRNKLFFMQTEGPIKGRAGNLSDI